MKRIVTLLTFILFISLGFSQTVYPGNHHTTSHGGHYTGSGGGSSHKGGHYTNVRTSNHYGRHKK